MRTRAMDRNAGMVTQFKSEAGGGGEAAQMLHHFVIRTLRRLLGVHELNAPLLRTALAFLPLSLRQELVMALADELSEKRPADRAASRKKRRRRLSPAEALLELEREGVPTRTLATLLDELEEMGAKALVVDDENEPDSFLASGFFAEGVSGPEDSPLCAQVLSDVIVGHLNKGTGGAAGPALVEANLGRLLAGLEGTEEVHTPELRKLQELFGLSPAEVDTVLFFLAYARVPQFERFCDSHRLPDWPRLMEAATGENPAGVRDLLDECSPLLKTGILCRVPHDSPPYFELSQAIADHLCGFAGANLEQAFFRILSGDAFPLESFQISAGDRKVVLGLLALDQPCSILFHGVPGTGKTEFARALAAATGRRACFVSCGDEGSPRERRVALVGATRMTRRERDLVVMDEADGLLNGCSGGFAAGAGIDKGWLNRFLDDNSAQVIWISNQIDEVPTSVLRRFDYSIDFRPFSPRQRLTMWRQVVSNSPLATRLQPGTLELLAASHQVEVGAIANAVARGADMLPDDAPESELAALLDRFVGRHGELVNGKPSAPPVATRSSYCVEALNLDQDRLALESCLRAAVEARAEGGKECRVNLLFSGPPGTGKTEYVRHLAASLGVPLVVRAASDLLNMFVGNTEKLIREAFREAQAQEAILFIDEADTFFYDRTRANHSFEVSQTNELLQRMEQHSGIFICCTNHAAGLDSAAIRRFDWKVQFRPLSVAGALATYGRFFGPSRPPLDRAQQHRLELLDGLTFGDFRALEGRLRFAAPANVDHERIIDELARELAWRKGGATRRLGFN